jgi:uncharacterized protein with PIN domain
MESEPRFIVDNMLGTVARWLRILGYDTVYDDKAEDWMILRRAQLESRIIITRDRGLHNKALKNGLRSILLWEDDMAERLAHIGLIAGIRLSVDLERTRCPLDNTRLVKVLDKREVKGKVPPRVYELHEDFWKYTVCGKVYWIGKHWRLIEKILDEARGKLEQYRARTSIK